jgi:uncharacterized lipoprotein YmbA
LFGCGSSPPVRYYTLYDVPGTAVAAAAPLTGAPIRLEPVVVASELDRIEFVTRVGPDRLRIADSELWAAPLEDQIRAILSADLATRLPPLLIVDPDEPISSEPRRLLSVSILEFLGDQACAVSLRVDWTLRTPGGDDRRGKEHVQVPGAEPCSGAPAAAMSRALGVLADRLAAAIRA